jgi:uncharacterized membrane protein
VSVSSDPASEATALYSAPALLASAALTAGFVLASADHLAWAQAPLGIFVLFFAPGYAGMALLFGKRAIPSYPANFALIVGLSVIFNVTIGVVLLYFSLGPINSIIGVAGAVLCFLASVAQKARHPTGQSSSATRRIGAVFRFPGFSRGQRAAAYALFAAVLLTFGVIGYIATLQPGNTPDLAMTLVGPDGTTSTLPAEGTVNTSLAVIVEVHNNATAQPFILSVNSSLVGENGTNFTNLPWAMPLHLAPFVTSEESLNLSKGGSESVSISFQFDRTGDYLVSFSLTPPRSATPVRSTAIAIAIT